MVQSETDYHARFAELHSPYQETLDVTFASNRKEAIDVLGANPFDRVVTALKIPRISDGYLLLSHILKGIGRDKVIVLADEKSEEVERSINMLGVGLVHSTSNIKGLLQILLEAAGIVPSEPEHLKARSPITVASGLDLDTVNAALGLVMGPVGAMILEEATDQWQDRENIGELLGLIETEIAEMGKNRTVPKEIGAITEISPPHNSLVFSSRKKSQL